jgi:hypothetical protein
VSLAPGSVLRATDGETLRVSGPDRLMRIGIGAMTGGRPIQLLLRTDFFLTVP